MQMPMLPDFYTGHDTYTRLSHAGPVVMREPGTVGDFAPTISGLGGLGQLDPYQEAPVESEGSGAGYFVMSSLGSAIAGGLVGYMASGGKQTGAGVGAALLGGVRGLSEAAVFLKEGKKELALVASLFSLVSLTGAFWVFTELRGAGSRRTPIFT